MKKKSTILKKHQRKKVDFSFPHIKTAFLISVMAFFTLAGSMLLSEKQQFWSSILANIFAGLVTGLVLCIVSGTKQRTIAELKNERDFLTGLCNQIREYFKIYGELHHMPIKRTNTSEENEEQFNFIYDVGVKANDVNSYIGQSQFKEILSFDPYEYCRSKFGYDVVAMSDENQTLKDYLSSVDVTTPYKKDLLEHFKPVDSAIRALYRAATKRLESLEVRLEAIEHSLL